MGTRDFEAATNELERKIRNLNTSLWNRRLTGAAVEQWITGFGTTSHTPEQIEALHQGARYLLTRFIFIGAEQRDALLRYLCRRYIRQPVVSAGIEMGIPIGDHSALSAYFDTSLRSTVVLPLGGPGKSGTHLLYPMRNHGSLPLTCFPSLERGWAGPPHTGDILRVIVVDDFSGTADQAEEYAERVGSQLSEAQGVGWQAETAELLLLCATDTALDRLRELPVFSEVYAACQFDESHVAFGRRSRYETDAYGIDWKLLKAEVLRLGMLLDSDAPWGYGDCQLLLGFEHNTPDNTLPIFRTSRQGHPAPFPRHVPV